MKIETIQTGNFSMDYFRFGQGKTPLVILPGLSVQSVMGSAEAVVHAYQLFSDDFTVYVLDRRHELPEEYSMYEMARDTAEAINSLRLGPVCLFGASQGGMLAALISIEHPELVGRLILGSTSARVTEETLSLIESWVRLAKAGNAEELYLSFGKALYPRSVFEQSRELLIEAAKSVTGEELARFVILAGSFDGFNVLQELKKITCPVLVIGSEDDRVLGGEASRQIAAQLPDCTLFMYDGYGHAAYDTAPDYKERILRFLSTD